MSETPEKDKFMAWLEREKEKGLVGINLFSTDTIKGASSEEVFRELNAMNEAYGVYSGRYIDNVERKPLSE